MLLDGCGIVFMFCNSALLVYVYVIIILLTWVYGFHCLGYCA